MDAATYYLVETAAPAGYKQLLYPVAVKIEKTADTTGATTVITGATVKADEETVGKSVTATINSLAEGSNEWIYPEKISTTTTTDEDGNETTATVTIDNGGVSIKNSAGVELPSTGGIGTTIFYVVGGILVLGAGVLLITKRRVRGK